MSTVRKALAELQSLADQAYAELNAARDAKDRAAVGDFERVVPLAKYADNVAYKIQSEDPDAQRAMTVALCREIIENSNLVLSSTRSRTALLRLDDRTRPSATATRRRQFVKRLAVSRSSPSRTPTN